ncbi:MAG: hypothetical protein H7Z37_15365 [Pyrinomonadaceae bacterium]|nr:hypothetical protein [Pyrinomonadaceae bacterium]
MKSGKLLHLFNIVIFAAMILICIGAENVNAQQNKKSKSRTGTKITVKKRKKIRAEPPQILRRVDEPPIRIGSKEDETGIMEKNGILFDGVKLIGSTPEEAEAMLGEAVEIEKNEITEEQLSQPGRHVFDEIRHYKVNGKMFIDYTLYGLRVRFLKSKAVGFDLDLPVAQDTPEMALAKVKIDVRGKNEFTLRSSATAKFWRDYFDGKELTVAATMFGDEERNKLKIYDLVEVRLYQQNEL